MRFFPGPNFPHQVLDRSQMVTIHKPLVDNWLDDIQKISHPLSLCRPSIMCGCSCLRKGMARNNMMFLLLLGAHGNVNSNF